MAEGRIYVGSFTPDRGEGVGITLLRRAVSGAVTVDRTVAETASPAFLARHPHAAVLYAVNSVPGSTVSAFAIDRAGGLRHLGSRPTGGDGATHLVVHPTGHYLLVANFRSGSLSVHRLGEHGRLCEQTDLVLHGGTGTGVQRERVHQVRFDPTGRYALAVDLGLDAIVSYHLDAHTGRLRERSRAYTPPGTGPRHLAFDPGGHVHVVGQSNATVVTFRYDDGVLHQTAVTTSTARPPRGENMPSEIAICADGHFAYVANRGMDVVTTFVVDGSRLRPIADTSSGGAWPRHLVLVSDDLYVANQHGNLVTHFRLGSGDRIPRPSGYVSRVPSPVCLLVDTADPADLTDPADLARSEVRDVR